ncbi:unnamed protein product [Prorocentrum cordatum]|uniref:Uncharacterized protein n=1 Tax=Prorocentrum cordatum TaxID=2364126 RepID=A0ABN9UQR0_9DINO|nr:unnamed protein product [Polarella glacialis]
MARGVSRRLCPERPRRAQFCQGGAPEASGGPPSELAQALQKEVDPSRQKNNEPKEAARSESDPETNARRQEMLRRAVRWAAQTAPADAVASREGELAALRERDRALRASGAVEEWFRGVDPAMRRVAQHVNGPLCAEIAERIAFCDPGCVEFFRAGAPLVGELPRSGHGSPEVFPPRLGIAELLGNAESTNRDISGGLRDGAHGDAILRKTRDEAELGRISCPVPLRDVCLDGAVIAPRFAVEQLREDGSSKLRLVDDMTKARINEATRPQERLHHDAVDALFEAARIFQAARVLLRIAALRYVGDYFGPDHPEVVEHAAAQLAELIQLMLGPGAAAPDKIAWGPPLVILGLEIKAGRPWRDAPAGRPLYAQSHRGASKAHEPLTLALQWWREVLAMDLCQARPWADKARPRATLFADASGQPPRVAAVLVTATGIRFTSMVAPDSLMASFQRRRDNQIQELELLSIALGMCTFAGIAFACDCPRRRAGCDLHIYSDNTGAESCLRKGAAKSFDHSCIVHSMWRRAVELDVDLAVFRVPTAVNLADLPSRRARARRAVQRAGRGTAVAWAADFLAENGFARACELASADAADLEGWPVTAQAPVPSVLDQLGAPVALPITRGPWAALAEAAARLRSPADAARWRGEERVRAMLQPCARSLPSVRSGLKCWGAYCIRMLKYPCMQLPPACADLVAWGALFRCGETCANYCSYVKIGCLLTGVCVAVFDRPEVRRARAAVRARADWTPRPRLFIRKSAVAALVELGARRPEWLRASMLFLFAYTFLLRVPSEALPAVRVADAGDAPPFQAALVLGKSELTLLLRRRKNRPQGSRLSRKCWCSSCRATCPVHTLGPWVARCGLGRGLFGGISAAAALRTLREMLAALGAQPRRPDAPPARGCFGDRVNFAYQGKQAALEADVGTAERDRAELRAAVADVFQPLKDGTIEQDTESKAAALVTKLQRLVHMEESLFTVAPAALGKVPAARGQFELMVVNEISQQCAKRLAAFDDQVEQAAPARAANADAVARAQAQLAEARGRQRASAEAFTAARTEQEQSEAKHVAAAKERREAGPRLTRAEKALQDAAGRLEGFLAGPAVSFAELRTRTAAAEEEPPLEAAPVPASCASEVAAAAGAAAAGAAEVAAVACA